MVLFISSNISLLLFIVVWPECLSNWRISIHQSRWNALKWILAHLKRNRPRITLLVFVFETVLVRLAREIQRGDCRRAHLSIEKRTASNTELNLSWRKLKAWVSEWVTGVGVRSGGYGVGIRIFRVMHPILQPSLSGYNRFQVSLTTYFFKSLLQWEQSILWNSY